MTTAHPSGYLKGCNCDRCEQARARSREHAKTYRHPDPARLRAYKTAKQKEYDKTRRAAQVAAKIAAGVKLCPRCQLTKPFDQFEPAPKKALGVSSHCRECKNEARQARYHSKNETERYGQRYREARAAAIRIYGGRCEGCGDSQRLEFDHINGDGGEHRKVEGATDMLRRIASSGQRITDWELRLLCASCHDFITNGVSRERVALLLASGSDWPSVAALPPAPLPAPPGLASQAGPADPGRRQS